MFALRMVQNLETHAEYLADELMYKLEKSKLCPSLLSKVGARELRMRTIDLYRNLSDWLLSKTQSEIEERYIGVGIRHSKQGVPFSEFLFAIDTTKECLWEYLEREGLLEDPVELLGDLNLLHAVGRFFSRIAYSVAIGYENAHKQEGNHCAGVAALAGGKSHNGRGASFEKR